MLSSWCLSCYLGPFCKALSWGRKPPPGGLPKRVCAVSIAAAADHLKTQGVVLRALVNNAGVAHDLPWATGPFAADTARTTLETNFFGAVRVTEAFAPLIASGGRIVNVSSGAGQGNMQKMSEAKRAEMLRTDLTLDRLRGLAEEFIAAYEEAAPAGDLPKAAESGHWLQAYGFSKACLNMLTCLQVSLCVHPRVCVHGSVWV